MTKSFSMNLNEVEFKDFLKQTFREILRESDTRAEQEVPEILSVAEAAEFLKLQVSTVYEKTSSRCIPHFKKGNRLYFHRKELETWLREGKVKTKDEMQIEASTYSMSRSSKAA